MKLLQVNVTVNSGSTGRIAEDIGKVMMRNGHQSAIAFGRGDRPSESKKIRIGGKLNVYNHVLQTRLLDNHGFSSVKATKIFISEIDKFQPDVVGLHNLHGYYLHVGILFEYLKKNKIPVVWTLHDCWPFTGHCAHFMRVNCEKWRTHCGKCPLTHAYPKSWKRDRSFQNFEEKKEAFTGHSNLKIVTPSLWLKDLVQDSFLQEYPVVVINNGIDTEVFKNRKISYSNNKKMVLGVASTWSKRKGLHDFFELRKKLSEEIEIILIGLSQAQIEDMPEGITGIARTESLNDLAEWYSRATVFVNPTYIDNFPTTNLEALACGTPVITYDTGGSRETVDDKTGIVVKKGDLDELLLAVRKILNSCSDMYTKNCRTRSIINFGKNDRYREYLQLYESCLK